MKLRAETEPLIVGRFDHSRPVVLYSRADSAVMGLSNTESLAEFARAQGLSVAAIRSDVCPPDRHMVMRPQWAHTVELIESGRAGGLVCMREFDIAHTAEVVRQLRGWLEAQGAFAVYPAQGPGRTETGR
ncbi:hypothetical protein OG897_40680 [Streptomyces sp. NBC_00237]|uniref:hypothetical protein n=1 Tax=Streptomyces sp. NBC_00237 TaxID=2975687 RepID=UPI002250A650|nr:hypothetical protein [Streptomyces sp. NBC_00237]MCX5207701.1 hypothetical protein [Streptomyces sp. NBC_00237]